MKQLSRSFDYVFLVGRTNLAVGIGIFEEGGVGYDYATALQLQVGRTQTFNKLSQIAPQAR